MKGSGSVDVRYSKSGGKARLRFYNVAPDQLENILIALRAARRELGTDHDSVALDMICLAYLSACGGAMRESEGEHGRGS